MKTFNKILKTSLVGLVICAGLILNSCSDKFTFTPAPTGTTITQIAGSNDSLKAFVAAINLAGMAANLDNVNGGQFTVFAPSNYAFVKFLRSQGVVIAATTPATAGTMAATAISALTVTSVPSINTIVGRLNYHVVSSAVPSTSITAGETFNTINGTGRLSLSIGSGTTPFIINANNASSGANIIDSGTAGANGVIYTIDKVMAPIGAANVWVSSLLNFGINYGVSPAVITVGGATIARDANNNYNVSNAPTDANDNNNNLFSAALVRANVAGLIFPNVSILPDYTVFTPTDGAVKAYLGVTTEAAALASINATDPAALAAVINYHIVNGRLLTTDFSNGAAITTLSSGNTFSVNTTNFVITDSKGATANITVKNNLSNAGVSHMIDKVLTHN